MLYYFFDIISLTYKTETILYFEKSSYSYQFISNVDLKVFEKIVFVSKFKQIDKGLFSFLFNISSLSLFFACPNAYILIYLITCLFSLEIVQLSEKYSW